MFCALLLVLRFRGHRRSTQTSTGNDMDTYAADVAVLTNELSLKDAIYIGHSTGGDEGAPHVARYGKGRVAKAMLVSSIPPITLKTANNPGGLPIEVFDGLRSALAASPTQSYREILLWIQPSGRTSVKRQSFSR